MLKLELCSLVEMAALPILLTALSILFDPQSVEPGGGVTDAETTPVAVSLLTATVVSVDMPPGSEDLMASAIDASLTCGPTGTVKEMRGCDVVIAGACGRVIDVDDPVRVVEIAVAKSAVADVSRRISVASSTLTVTAPVASSTARATDDGATTVGSSDAMMAVFTVERLDRADTAVGAAMGCSTNDTVDVEVSATELTVPAMGGGNGGDGGGGVLGGWMYGVLGGGGSVGGGVRGGIGGDGGDGGGFEGIGDGGEGGDGGIGGGDKGGSAGVVRAGGEGGGKGGGYSGGGDIGGSPGGGGVGDGTEGGTGTIGGGGGDEGDGGGGVGGAGGEGGGKGLSMRMITSGILRVK